MVELAGMTAERGETIPVRRPPTAACGGTSPTGGEGDVVGLVPKADTNDEKTTNEPEVDDNVMMLQTQEIVEVAANSEVETGLDKTTNEPDLGSIRDDGQIRIPLVGGARSDVAASEDAAAETDPASCLDTPDRGEISPAPRVAIAAGGGSCRDAEGEDLN